MLTRRPDPGPNTLDFAIAGRVERGDVPQLCERVRTLLERCDARVVVCDVSAVMDPDAVTVEALARLQLTARRLGRGVWLRDASSELRDLLAFVGMSEVVPLVTGPRVEPGR